MKPELKLQHGLMTKAINLLNDIEILEGWLKGIESGYLYSQKQQREIEYAETMSELAGELVKLAKPITNNQTQD